MMSFERSLLKARKVIPEKLALATVPRYISVDIAAQLLKRGVYKGK
jgi:hypothetical protein